jgi:hypothetical protein
MAARSNGEMSRTPCGLVLDSGHGRKYGEYRRRERGSTGCLWSGDILGDALQSLACLGKESNGSLADRPTAPAWLHWPSHPFSNLTP